MVAAEGFLRGRSVLVTGGAGFIGSHLTRELIQRGAQVRVLDNLDPQAHENPEAAQARVTGYGAEFIEADVCDRAIWPRALHGVEFVVHFAAMVGVGQSMYEIRRYCEANVMGTASLLEAVAEQRDTIGKVLVASSMSIYGEGLFACPICETEQEASRTTEALKVHHFEPACAACGSDLVARPTPERKEPIPTSVYALNKLDQERLCLIAGRAYGIPTVATRFFNVYGPGQSLSNPYTGVAAIFASRLLGGQPPIVFEDGGQTRDFIHVADIARGCAMALESEAASDTVLNLGTGSPVSIRQIGDRLQALLGGPSPEIVGEFRAGDIRHCVSDPTLAAELLGWSAQVRLDDGMAELVEWQRTQQAEPERVEAALGELKARGLVG